MQQTTIRKRHSGRRSKRRPYDNCAIDACMSKEDALRLWDELHYWSGYFKRRGHCDAHLLYMRFEREILDLHSDDDAKAFMLEHKGTDYATEVEHATGAATFRYAIEKLYDEGLCMRKCEVLYLILLMNRADNLKLATKRVNALLGLFEQMAIKTTVGKEPDYNALNRGMGCLWVELGDDFKPGAPCAGTSLEMWEYEMEHLKANIDIILNEQTMMFPELKVEYEKNHPSPVELPKPGVSVNHHVCSTHHICFVFSQDNFFILKISSPFLIQCKKFQ